MKKSLSLLMLLGLSLAVTSCASNTKNKVEEKIENVSINNEKHLQAELRKAINESQHLNDDQKTKLIALDDRYVLLQKEMKEEITKAKVVLLETVAKKELNNKEYKAIKSKIIELNKKRVHSGLKMADEIRTILFPKTSKSAAVSAEDKEADHAKRREMYYMIYRHQLNDL